MEFTPTQKRNTAKQIIGFLEKHNAWQPGVLIFTDHRCYVPEPIPGWNYPKIDGKTSKGIPYSCYMGVKASLYTYSKVDEDGMTILHEGGKAERMMIENSRPLFQYVNRRLEKYGLHIETVMPWYSTVAK